MTGKSKATDVQNSLPVQGRAKGQSKKMTVNSTTSCLRIPSSGKILMGSSSTDFHLPMQLSYKIKHNVLNFDFLLKGLNFGLIG